MNVMTYDIALRATSGQGHQVLLHRSLHDNDHTLRTVVSANHVTEQNHVNGVIKC